MNEYGEIQYYPLQQHYTEAYAGYLNEYDSESGILLQNEIQFGIDEVVFDDSFLFINQQEINITNIKSIHTH